MSGDVTCVATLYCLTPLAPPPPLSPFTAYNVSTVPLPVRSTPAVKVRAFVFVNDEKAVSRANCAPLAPL